MTTAPSTGLAIMAWVKGEATMGEASTWLTEGT
jgi:hypothetical protein